MDRLLNLIQRLLNLIQVVNDSFNPTWAACSREIGAVFNDTLSPPAAIIHHELPLFSGGANVRFGKTW
jgi:hypothetical protein